MLKKIKLNIHSYIDNLDNAGLPDGDPEITHSEYTGTLKSDTDGIKLSYKEDTESGAVFCDILIKDNSVTVRRGGAIVSTLLFAVGRDFKTVYELPPYKFDMTVKTKRIRSSITCEGGTLDILYEMEVGGAAKRTKMKIEVSSV